MDACRECHWTVSKRKKGVDQRGQLRHLIGTSDRREAAGQSFPEVYSLLGNMRVKIFK